LNGLLTLIIDSCIGGDDSTLFYNSHRNVLFKKDRQTDVTNATTDAAENDSPPHRQKHYTPHPHVPFTVLLFVFEAMLFIFLSYVTYIVLVSAGMPAFKVKPTQTNKNQLIDR